MKRFALPALFLLVSFTAGAAPDSDTLSIDSVNSFMEKYAGLDTFHYQTSGKIALGIVASLDIPKGFKFLDGKQAASVLHDVWKNPYSESLGMLMPEDRGPFDPYCWAVNITYEEDGHVKDDDAKDIKYDELLKQMQQQQVEETNAERVRQGWQGYRAHRLGRAAIL